MIEIFYTTHLRYIFQHIKFDIKYFSSCKRMGEGHFLFGSSTMTPVFSEAKKNLQIDQNTFFR